MHRDPGAPGTPPRAGIWDMGHLPCEYDDYDLWFSYHIDADGHADVSIVEKKTHTTITTPPRTVSTQPVGLT